MRSVISRAGRWPLAFACVALGACADTPTAPTRSPAPVAVADVATTSELTTVVFTVDSAKINRYYGDVLVSGTATCSSPAMFTLAVKLQQEQRAAGSSSIVEGSGGIPEFQCSPEGKTWRIDIGGYIGLWDSRPGTVTVRTEDVGEGVTPAELVQVVRLTRKR